jgi:hypothetical protein
MKQLGGRAAYLLRTEGVRGLLAGGCRYLASLGLVVFYVERYVVFQFDTDTSALPARRPDMDGLEVFVLERVEDIERLAERGFEVAVFDSARRRGWLQRGGVAFCVYVNRELAHIAWVAMSAAAREFYDQLPYHVDFEHGEAWWGGSYTVRRFRGRGIYTYVCGIRLKYLHEHGFTVCRDAVRADNVASLKGQGWWNARPCVAGRLVHFFKWTRWREYPCRKVNV